jgi:hypothetical protein
MREYTVSTRIKKLCHYGDAMGKRSACLAQSLHIRLVFLPPKNFSNGRSNTPCSGYSADFATPEKSHRVWPERERHAAYSRVTSVTSR